MATGGAAGEDVPGGGEFYLRYYVGHKGKFGHEFLEFEFRPDGKLRYANNSNYKNDTMIRKEVFVSPSVLREARRIIQESEVGLPLPHRRFLGLGFISNIGGSIDSRFPISLSNDGWFGLVCFLCRL